MTRVMRPLNNAGAHFFIPASTPGAYCSRLCLRSSPIEWRTRHRTAILRIIMSRRHLASHLMCGVADILPRALSALGMSACARRLGRWNRLRAENHG